MKIFDGLNVQNVATLPGAGQAGRVLFLTADNHLYGDNGTSWVSLNPIYKYRTTSQTVEGDTLTNDTVLKITAPLAGTYHFQFKLFMNDTGTAGIQYAVTGATTLFGQLINYGISVVNNIISLTSFNEASISSTSGDELFCIVMEGIAVMNGTNDFQLQFANAGADVTQMLTNSFLKWTKIS